MSALTRLERMDDMFQDFFRRPWRGLPMPADLPSDIRVNVTENPSEYVLKAELPGAKKEDIRVSIDGHVVTVSAEVKHEEEKKEGSRVLMRELVQGSVSRSLTLPLAIDDKEASAKFDNGVLELKLPKRAEAKGRVIKVG